MCTVSKSHNADASYLFVIFLFCEMYKGIFYCIDAVDVIFINNHN